MFANVCLRNQRDGRLGGVPTHRLFFSQHPDPVRFAIADKD